MRNVFALVALFAVAPLTVAHAAPPADKGAPKGKDKAKPGETCKVDNDCDQSAGPYLCQNGKCHSAPPPIPPT